jgi:putative nucleotidyltransferase with HDIG domain
MPQWRKILPELEWITDEGLAELVEKVWEDAFDLGGWEESDLDKIPFTLLVPDTDINLFDHTRIVTSLCRQIAVPLKEMQGLDINDDYLIAGALLHDVGKLLEYEKKDGQVVVARSGRLLRHPLSGMGLTVKWGLPEEISHTIAVHSREGERSPRSVEATIIHHADFIMFHSFKSRKEFPDI